MTSTVSSGRLQSVDLIPGLAVTVLGGGRAGATAGLVLRALGAQVSTVDASWRDVDIAGLDGDAVVVCDVVTEGAEADYLGRGSDPQARRLGDGVRLRPGRPPGWPAGFGSPLRCRGRCASGR